MKNLNVEKKLAQVQKCMCDWHDEQFEAGAIILMLLDLISCQLKYMNTSYVILFWLHVYPQTVVSAS